MARIHWKHKTSPDLAPCIARGVGSFPLLPRKLRFLEQIVRRTLLATLVLGLYVLHQDWWNWTSARPLFLGFLPRGLWYHGLFSVASCICMALLVRLAWPRRLETLVEESARSSRETPRSEEPRG